MDHQFRNAVFGGFNRQDVLDYLETLARENAQKRQELEQSIGRAEGERDELRTQNQALEEQKRALEGEKEELLRSVQRSQSELAALRTQMGEREQTARQTQQALEESRREAEALRVQVADNGAGMSAEVQRRMFEKFYQGDASRPRRETGWGCRWPSGLSTCTGDASTYPARRAGERPSPSRWTGFSPRRT